MLQPDFGRIPPLGPGVLGPDAALQCSRARISGRGKTSRAFAVEIEL
jgi:hypothetical protein